MSGDIEPQRKRQKRGDEKEAAETIALGGPMYDEATARKMLKEVVLVTAENAKDGEAVIGFDPDDASLDNAYYAFDDSYYWFGEEITPMLYSVQKGDEKMCRYLISRGASTTKSSGGGDSLCPMHVAAQLGHLNICKLLYANGAQNDVWKDDGYGWTPFHCAARNGHDEVVRWLTFHGALCTDSSSEMVEGDRIYPYLETQHKWRMNRSFERLVEWAKEVTQSHSAVITFLCGALPPAPDEDESRTLQCLSVHPGIRKLIGDFVGLEITKGKHLRILRHVVEVLPSFIIRTRASY